MPVVGRLDQYGSMLAGEFDDYSMSENLLTYSEQFNDASWQRPFSTISSNIILITAPDGTNTADKIVEDSTNNQHNIYKTRTGSNETVTFSVFCKAAERTKVWLQLSNFSTSTAQAIYDLSAGTAGSPSSNNSDYTNNSTKIVAYPNGWYRCILTTTKGSVNTTNNPTISPTDASGNLSYLGNGTSGIYVWGAQLEFGSVATEYTPTTTTAINRVLSSTANTSITSLGTYYSSGFSENIGDVTTLVANVFPPYDPVYDDFGGTLFGVGQGRYMRQNIDNSVIVYNEIDEVSTIVENFGQSEYTTPGTYTWTAPAGVTSVCVVCVGGGGGGSYGTDRCIGGAGGGLGWKNYIPVTPGAGYTVVVGAGGTRSTAANIGNPGGNSYFINTSTVAGFGGEGGTGGQGGAALVTKVGGGYVGDGGGNGGSAITSNNPGGANGGGGAGGYSGNGGNGGNRETVTSATAGSGGGGGGGGYSVNDSTDAGAGGGVGIYGQGSNGVAGASGSTIGNGGGGGSAGADGGNSISGNGTGGLYGGGGGAQDLGTPTLTLSGGGGAVRIIWGANRSFPSTNTQNI